MVTKGRNVPGVKALVGFAMMALPAYAIGQTPGQLPLLVGAGGSNMSFSVPIQTLLFLLPCHFCPQRC